MRLSLQEAVSVSVGVRYLLVHVSDFVSWSMVAKVMGGVGVVMAVHWVHIHAMRVVMNVMMVVVVSIVMDVVDDSVVNVMVAIMMTIVVSIVVGVSFVVSWLCYNWVAVVVSVMVRVAGWGNLVLLSVGMLGGVSSFVVMSWSMIRVDWLSVSVTMHINDWMMVV